MIDLELRRIRRLVLRVNVEMESGEATKVSTYLALICPRIPKGSVPFEEDSQRSGNIDLPILCDLGFGSHSGKTGLTAAL